MSPLMLRHNCLTIIQSHTESRESKNGTPTRIFRRSKFLMILNVLLMKMSIKGFYSVVRSYELCTHGLIFTKNRVIFHHLLSNVFTTVSTYCLTHSVSMSSFYLLWYNSSNMILGLGENFDPFRSIYHTVGYNVTVRLNNAVDRPILDC